MAQELPRLVETDAAGLATTGASPAEDDEVYVEDGRALLTPTQEVERMLLRALHASPALVSQLQRSYLPRPR